MADNSELMTLLGAADGLVHAASGVHPTAPSIISMERLHKAADLTARMIDRCRTTPVTAEAGEVSEAEVEQRVLGAIDDFREMQPESDEDWESWYSAAFDLAREKVSRILAARRVQPKQDAPSPDDEWQGDPASDERWNAGCVYAMRQLCAVLGVDPKRVSWDAATETLDGDVCSVIGNILVAHFGEDWSPSDAPSPDVKGLIEALQSRSNDPNEKYVIRDLARAAAAALSRITPPGGRDGSA